MTRLAPLIPVARAHWEKARQLRETEEDPPSTSWMLDTTCANEERRFARAYGPDLNPFQMTIDRVQLARPFCLPAPRDPAEVIHYYRQRGFGDTLFQAKYVIKLRRVHLINYRIASIHTILIDESDRIIERRDTEWRLPTTFFERLISNFQRGPRPLLRTSIAAMNGNGVAYMRVVVYGADGATPEQQELSFAAPDPRFGISSRTEGPGPLPVIERYRIYPAVAWSEKLVLLSPLEAGLQAFRLPEGNLTSNVLPVLDATLTLGPDSSVTCVEGRELEDNGATTIYRDTNTLPQGCAVAAR